MHAKPARFCPAEKERESAIWSGPLINGPLCRNHESRLPQNRPVPKSSLCKICVRECPVDGALTLDPAIPVVADACTGCGKCVHACPTQAIVVNVFEAGKKPRLKKSRSAAKTKGRKAGARTKSRKVPARKQAGSRPQSPRTTLSFLLERFLVPDTLSRRNSNGYD